MAQTQKILVAYTTNAGTTEEVAAVIGEELGKDGVQVDVRRLEEVTDLESYTAVVVGGPMIMGWHKAAVKFVKQHQQALSQVPVAYFLTAMSLTQTGEHRASMASAQFPLCIDPMLAKAPKNANRLGLKERYATVTNYLRPVLRSRAAGQAREHRALRRQARILPLETVADALRAVGHPGAAGGSAQLAGDPGMGGRSASAVGSRIGSE